MNDIDIANIKKELAKRKAANYEWKDGGEMPKDDVIFPKFWSSFIFSIKSFILF